MESTPETSKHTSIFLRIDAIKDAKQPQTLMRFVGNHRQHMLQQFKSHTNHQRIRGMGKAKELFKQS
jgi:hypothetical protein